MDEDRIRQALKACLRGAEFGQERQLEVIRQVRGEKRVKKMGTVALALALVCLMGSMALAAGFGVFGSFVGGEYSEMSSARLAHLDESADEVGKTVTVTAPGEKRSGAASANSVEAILGRLAGRTYELTVDQAYCDGMKLYYSYTLKTEALRKDFIADGIIGEIEWILQEPGKRYTEVWGSEDDEESRKIAAWLDSHDAACVVEDTVGIGDGAWLDGEPLMIYDSGSQWIDENTLTGFQEVRLPDGYEAGEELNVQIHVLYGARVTYQDSTGVYYGHIAPGANRGILPVDIALPVHGSVRAMSGMVEEESYTAKARLFVSDVDVYGEVIFSGVDGWLKKEPSGQVDTQTFVMLAQAAGDEANAAVQGNIGLWPGYTGEEAAAVQQNLKKLGLYDGNITGVMGEKTVEAVKTFQAEKGIGGDPFNITNDAIISFVLAIGDQEMRNLDGGFTGIVDGTYTVYLRFDLPKGIGEMDSLTIRAGNGRGAEIVVR